MADFGGIEFLAFFELPSIVPPSANYLALPVPDAEGRFSSDQESVSHPSPKMERILFGATLGRVSGRGQPGGAGAAPMEPTARRMSADEPGETIRLGESPHPRGRAVAAIVSRWHRIVAAVRRWRKKRKREKKPERDRGWSR